MTVLQESRTCQYVNSSILKRRSGLHLGTPSFRQRHAVLFAPLGHAIIPANTPVIPAKAGIWTSTRTPLYTHRPSRSVRHTPSFPRTHHHSREGGNLDVHSHSIVHTSSFSLPIGHAVIPANTPVIPAKARIWTSIPTPLYTLWAPAFPQDHVFSLQGRARRLPPPLPESLLPYPTDG